MDIEEIALVSVMCPYCMADRGKRCRRKHSGAVANYFHKDRLVPVYAGWRMGYKEGLADAVDNPGYAQRAVARERGEDHGQAAS